MVKKDNYIVFDIETTGLKPWFGNQVTCICAKDNNQNTFRRCAKGLKDEVEYFSNSKPEWMQRKLKLVMQPMKV